jgi:hypothetical protein
MPSRFLCALYQILIYRLKITLLAPSADEIRATLLNFGGHIVLYSAPLNVPDRRSRSLEVVVIRRINNLGTGNLEWGGSRGNQGRGRSVYKQPGTRVDGSCHNKEGSK